MFSDDNVVEKMSMTHLTLAQLTSGLEAIRQSPKDDGVVMMIVRRPRTDERDVLEVCELDAALGLVGDNWFVPENVRTTNGMSQFDTQLTIMNSRVIQLVAAEKTRWPLAGDQLFVDLDLSAANLPPGTQIAVGSAVLEITAEPHLGCRKFAARFGVEALKFVNSEIGCQLNLRGVNARIIQSGTVRVGDTASKRIRG